jgi:hypothetical protein
MRPNYPYDPPFLPYNVRAGFKFLCEYDSDFSRATIEGDLSKGFSAEDALRRVKCPMLLLRADAYRHETWGLVRAIDDDDLACIVSLVADLQVVQISGGHEIHLAQPQRYIDEVLKFVDRLRDENKLPRMADGSCYAERDIHPFGYSDRRGLANEFGRSSQACNGRTKPGQRRVTRLGIEPFIPVSKRDHEPPAKPLTAGEENTGADMQPRQLSD